MTTTNTPAVRCKGLFGRLFGHNYQPRYSEGSADPSVMKYSVFEQGFQDLSEVIAAGKSRTYHGEVCDRCGDRLMPGREKENLDVAGVSKTELTVLEDLGLRAINLSLAWCDDVDRGNFPEEAEGLMRVYLDLAQQRRNGVG